MWCNRKLTFASTTVLLLLASLSGARAQCPALPYSLANGQVADATQVMADFNSVVNCVNTKGTVNNAAAGQIGYYAAAGTVISGQSLSNLLDTAVGSAQGSVMYRGSAGWTALGPGTNGYVLQSGGAAANPSWTAPTGGSGGITTIVAAGVSAATSTIALPSVPVISRPTLASMTWLNQASATGTDNANGPLVLRTTQNTAGLNGINALTKSVAGANWTVTTQYALGNHFGGAGQDLSGLVVYNSANGRLYICGVVSSTSIAVYAYNSTTSWNSNAGTKSILANASTIWTRAQYTSSSTTLTFSYSVDGFNWETIFTTSAPFIGVATAYGIGVGTQNNATGLVLSLNYMSDTTP